MFGAVDYALQTQTVEDTTHFSLIVTLAEPTAEQLTSLWGSPLILLPDRLVGKSTRGVERRVFLHRAWIRSGEKPPNSLYAEFVFEDSAEVPVSVVNSYAGVFSPNTGSDVLVSATGVIPQSGAYGGLTDSKGLRLRTEGEFKGGPYSDITIGVFGAILPATALAATDQPRSENSQTAERKASDDASTNQKAAGVHQTEEKP